MAISKRMGWIFAVMAAVTYSTNTPIARGAIVEGMAPLTLLAGRFVLAAALFGGTMLWTSWGEPGEGQARLHGRGLLICIGSGILNGLALVFFYNALQFLSASLTSMMGAALYPILTLVLLRWGGESITARKVLRLVLSVMGLYFLIDPSGGIDWLGVGLVAAGASCFAVHVVSVQWYLRSYNTWVTTAVMIGAGAAVILLLWLWQGADVFVPGWVGWLAILFQAVMATYVGRFITYAAISAIGSGQFALLSPLETLLTLVWAFLFLGEGLTAVQGIGAGCVLLGAVLATGRLRWPRRWGLGGN